MERQFCPWGKKIQANFPYLELVTEKRCGDGCHTDSSYSAGSASNDRGTIERGGSRVVGGDIKWLSFSRSKLKWVILL